MSRYERELIKVLEKNGWTCHRVAGSGTQRTAVCDVIAIKGGKVKLIEVKAAREIYYSSKNREQLEELRNVAKRCKATPVLAVKIKRRCWRFINLLKKVPLKVE
jgi:Holliday junction resolvase